MIKTERFGYAADGKEVLAFTLTDGEASATVLNYGGAVQSILVPDKNGKLTDVVLGYKDVASYENNGGCLGALIGRFGNRIDRGRLTIDGQKYALYCNNDGNHLHGGKVGFDKKLWSHEICGEELLLTLFSPDGEENYPGNLQVKVIYTFQNRELKIRYFAVSDKKTAINLTNHSYFNLNGENSGLITAHTLFMDSNYIVPTNEKLIPEGGFKLVKGTPFDFKEPKDIMRDVACEADRDIRYGKGYDHCYLLKSEGKRFVRYARVVGEETGISMDCYTDMPAVHFYTGNFLDQRGKRAYYAKHAGFCLETEAIPNNVNVPEYAEKGSSIFDAGEEYAFTASYKFGV